MTYVVPDADGRIGPDALRAALAAGHRAGDAGAREPRTGERLRRRGAGAGRARGGRAVSHRCGAGGRKARRRRRRAGRRCADAVGAQDSRAEGGGRDLSAAGRAVRAARRGRTPGARAPRRHGERERHRRLRRRCAAGRAERSEAVARVAGLRERLEARLLAIAGARATAMDGIGCRGRSTSASRARRGSLSRRRWISKASASRPARRVRRARWRRRRCCWRLGCRGRRRGARSGSGSGRGIRRRRSIGWRRWLGRLWGG